MRNIKIENKISNHKGQLVNFIKVLTKPHGLTNVKDQNNEILTCRLINRNLNILKTKNITPEQKQRNNGIISKIAMKLAENIAMKGS